MSEESPSCSPYTHVCTHSTAAQCGWKLRLLVCKRLMGFLSGRKSLLNPSTPRFKHVIKSGGNWIRVQHVEGNKEQVNSRIGEAHKRRRKWEKVTCRGRTLDSGGESQTVWLKSQVGFFLSFEGQIKRVLFLLVVVKHPNYAELIFGLPCGKLCDVTSMPSVIKIVKHMTKCHWCCKAVSRRPSWALRRSKDWLVN